MAPRPPSWTRILTRRKITLGAVGAVLLGGLGWAVKLGWQPLRASKPDESSKSAATVFNVSSSNQSGGITAGQVIQQPLRRDLSNERLREGLISLLSRSGARVEVSSLVEPEAMRFEYEIKNFLVSQGFDVLGSANTQVGGRPAYGQDVYELDGVYVIELGADDGSREWKHVTSTSSMFRPRKDLATAHSVPQDRASDPGH